MKTISDNKLPVILALFIPLIIIIALIPVMIRLSDANHNSNTRYNSFEGFGISDTSLPDSYMSDSYSTIAVSGYISDITQDSNVSDNHNPDNAVSGNSGFSTTVSEDGYINIGIEPARDIETMDNTAEFFADTSRNLSAVFDACDYYYEEVLLDKSTATYAYVLAKNSNYAANLNGYFYYLIDTSGSTVVVSPAVLNIAVLFNDENRDKCTADGTFAQKDISDLLNKSLFAILGKHYDVKIYNFIMDNYRDMFTRKINGEKYQFEAKIMSLPGIDVVYRDSFMTYIEFFITEN